MSAVEGNAEELVRILLEVMGEQDRRDVLKRVAEAHPQDVLSAVSDPVALLQAAQAAMAAQPRSDEERFLAEEAADVLRRYAGEREVGSLWSPP
jgi:hypothetical protein